MTQHLRCASFSHTWQCIPTVDSKQSVKENVNVCIFIRTTIKIDLLHSYFSFWKIDEVDRVARKFFELSAPEKKEYSRDASTNSGWVAVEQERYVMQAPVLSWIKDCTVLW